MKLDAKQRDALRAALTELGRRGGKASAKKLSPKQRTAKARKAGLARQAKARKAKKGRTR